MYSGERRFRGSEPHQDGVIGINECGREKERRNTSAEKEVT